MAEKKIESFATYIILAGWLFAIIGAASINFIDIFIEQQKAGAPYLPTWIMVLFIVASLLLLAGVILKSLGAGASLNADTILSIALDEPFIYFSICYFVLMCILPILSRLLLVPILSGLGLIPI